MIKPLTISEAAEYLDVTSATLRRWVRSGKITPFSAKWYGSRSHKNKRLMTHLKKMAQRELTLA